MNELSRSLHTLIKINSEHVKKNSNTIDCMNHAFNPKIHRHQPTHNPTLNDVVIKTHEKQKSRHICHKIVRITRITSCGFLFLVSSAGK